MYVLQAHLQASVSLTAGFWMMQGNWSTQSKKRSVTPKPCRCDTTVSYQDICGLINLWNEFISIFIPSSWLKFMNSFGADNYSISLIYFSLSYMHVFICCPLGSDCVSLFQVGCTSSLSAWAHLTLCLPCAHCLEFLIRRPPPMHLGWQPMAVTGMSLGWS